MAHERESTSLGGESAGDWVVKIHGSPDSLKVLQQSGEARVKYYKREFPPTALQHQVEHVAETEAPRTTTQAPSVGERAQRVRTAFGRGVRGLVGGTRSNAL